MNIEKYVEKLRDLPFQEISIGVTTIYLFSSDEVIKGQSGYSIDLNGNLLVGDKNGDWKRSGLVIGYEDLCGDPIFVDFEKVDFPVYTAIHGTGSWKEILIADNFYSFVKSLEIIAKYKLKEFCLKEIKDLNKQSDLEFWEILFEE